MQRSVTDVAVLQVSETWRIGERFPCKSFAGAHVVETKNENVFVHEYNLLFDEIAHLVDTGVPRRVGRDVPAIVKQENLHAVLHNVGRDERLHETEDPLVRWQWLIFIGRIVLHRLGPLSIATLSMLEASSLPIFWFPFFLPFIRNSMAPVIAFHGIEEIEHGVVTSYHLRQKLGSMEFFWGLLAYPGTVIFSINLFLLPPVVLLLSRPSLLFRLQTYPDLILYYMTMIPTFVCTILLALLYSCLGIPEVQWLQNYAVKFMKDYTKSKGVSFEIVETVDYTIPL